MAAAPFTPAARNRTLEAVSRDGLSETPRNLVDIDWAFDQVDVDLEQPRA